MELKIPPVIQVIITAAVMWLLARLVPFATVGFSGASWLGGFFLIAGVAVALSGVLAFRKANTTVDPRTPDKTSTLVIHGIYRYSRNPMYLGFLIILIGVYFFLTNFLSAICLSAFIIYMNRYQIEPEEKFMREKFGAEFEQYTARVRRWI